MIQDVQSELASSVGKSHDALRRELTRLRAGRANASLLDGIRVDYYGTPTPLAQMAHVNVPEARLLVVKPWDRSQIKAVEKALRESDLGLNPQVDADVVRVPLPPLTEERRKEFVKIARKQGEECKVAIRKARHDAIDTLGQLEGDGESSADDVERAKKKVEETIQDAIKQVDLMISTKEKTFSKCDQAARPVAIAPRPRLTPTNPDETLCERLRLDACRCGGAERCRPSARA